MGRKKQPQTTPEYGFYLVSLLFRLTEVMGWQAQQPPRDTGVTLEKTLQSTITVPEIKQQAPVLLERLNSVSSAEWKQAVITYITVWSNICSNMLIQMGKEDPLHDLLLEAKVRFLMPNVNLSGGIDEVALFFRQQATYYLERIGLGDTEALKRLLGMISGGLFTEESGKSVAILNMTLLAAGGRDLVDEVNQAVIMLKERLNSSIEFRAAVEIVEKQQKWEGLLKDQRFEEVLDNLQPKAMGIIKGKHWIATGVYYIDNDNEMSWDEEESLSMTSIFEELRERAHHNPAKLITDAWDGKLANSLVAAVKDKIQDEIKYLLAHKRDIRKRVSIDKVEEDEDGGIRQIALTDESPPDMFEREDRWNELVSQLTVSEKTIWNLLEQGYTQKEIALTLGKSQTSISIEIKSLQDKLKNLRLGSNDK